MWESPDQQAPSSVSQTPLFPGPGSFTGCEPPTDPGSGVPTERSRHCPCSPPRSNLGDGSEPSCLACQQMRTAVRRRGRGREASAQGSTPHACWSPSRQGLDTRCKGIHQASSAPSLPSSRPLPLISGGSASPASVPTPASTAHCPVHSSVHLSTQLADWLPGSPLICFLNGHCAHLTARCWVSGFL